VTYSIICTWKNKSGVHWDDTTGATINTTEDRKTWDEFLATKVCVTNIR
jgi:hypothetical protein